MTSPDGVPVRDRIGDKVQLRKRGRRGIWTAEFHHDGQHRRKSMKTANLKIAQDRAIKLANDLSDGSFRKPVATRPPLLIADAITQFMTAKEAEKRAAKTLVKYRHELDRFSSFLQSRRVTLMSAISPALFDAYRVTRGEKRSDKTAYVALMVIKTFLNWVVRRELLDRNPLRACKVSEPYVAPKTSATLEQVNQILTAAAGVRQIQYAILAFTGLRAGELQHLRPQDVDVKNGWIHVRAHGDWQPKTRRARKIPIHPRLSGYLAAILTTSKPYYFCAATSVKYPKGDHLINIKHLNEDFQAVARRLGFPTGRKNDGLVIHSLRHFFETQAVDSGVPQFVVDAWMGHVGHGTTGRIYYGLTDQKSQQYLRSVNLTGTKCQGERDADHERNLDRPGDAGGGGGRRQGQKRDNCGTALCLPVARYAAFSTYDRRRGGNGETGIRTPVTV